ncbi:MAG TPA: tetratricopeptide repeat protein [Desulfuromonadales bacterium]|nr:tetratricopeptide repeat protein [Desulfuromonadales bacterium]
MAALVIISMLTISPAYSLENEDSQVFIAGFNAFQLKDYTVAIAKMNEVLQKFPDTPLRDMALFWLARSYYRAGNHQNAAKYLAQFSKEYPENPLKGTVEEELLALTTRYERGEKLPVGPVAASGVTAQKGTPVKKERASAAKIEQIATAERERIAAEQASKLKAEQDRVAAKKAEAERQAAEASAAKKASLAATQREQERIAADQAAKAKAAQAAQVKAEQAAKLKVEQERVAALQAEIERKGTEVAAREKGRIAEEKAAATRKAYREKAIEQYKAIIDSYPGTAAAVTAATKLRELGLAVALPVVPVAETPIENSQVLKLQVAQFSGFEFNLLPRPDTFSVAGIATVPFEIVNRGNGNDSFSLESAFPAEFRTRFARASDLDTVVSQTPLLAPGESFKGALLLNIPTAYIDGQRIIHPIKVASRMMTEASQSREVRLAVSAPLLRAVLNVDTTQPLPGEKLVYRIAILNVGSTVAQDVTLRLSFPQQLEALDNAAAGFRSVQASTLVLDGLQVKSGERREFTLSFLLKDDSLAGQELSVRAELINNPLKRSVAFVSNVASVKSLHGVLIRTTTDRLVVVPGQTVTVPFVVTNTGNLREKFKVTPSFKDVQDAVVFYDKNRDGIRQSDEPVITEIGPLTPKEEASVGIEIRTHRSAADGNRGNVQVVFVSAGDSNRSATGTAQLLYSRPVLQLEMAGRNGSLKPGEIASYDLTVHNKGSNLAQIVELQSTWSDLLELVSADPVNSVAADGRILWRFKEVGAGEKRSIKVSFRVKAGTGAGTLLQVKNILTYEDQAGNKY